MINARLGGKSLTVGFMVPRSRSCTRRGTGERASGCLVVTCSSICGSRGRGMGVRCGNVRGRFHCFCPSLGGRGDDGCCITGTSGGHGNGLGTAFVVHVTRICLVTTRTSVCVGNNTGTVKCVGGMHTHTKTGTLANATAIHAILSREKHRLYNRCYEFCSLGHANVFGDSGCLRRARPSLTRFFGPGCTLQPVSAAFATAVSGNTRCRGPKCWWVGAFVMRWLSYLCLWENGAVFFRSVKLMITCQFIAACCGCCSRVSCVLFVLVYVRMFM